MNFFFYISEEIIENKVITPKRGAYGIINRVSVEIKSKLIWHCMVFCQYHYQTSSSSKFEQSYSWLETNLVLSYNLTKILWLKGHGEGMYS